MVPYVELEVEIKELEQKSNPSSADKTRLSELKTEVEKINKRKSDYVVEHPEHRHLVYKKRKIEGEKLSETVVPEKRNLFNKKGLPRHPERSIYYDPVMNPFGVPPPGMPYVERPLLAGEVDTDEESDDNDIAMPEGPPPGFNEEPVESDDEIPMPEGPVPVVEPPASTSLPLSSTTTAVIPETIQPLLPPLLPLAFPMGIQAPLPIPLPPPPPPLGFSPGHPALLPPGFPAMQGIPPGHPANFTPPGLPPPPPGFFPRARTAASLQDPLSGVPHTTYQIHRANQATLPNHPSLPSKPESSQPSSMATISAEPELRDLKKEATSFVPTSLKRKRPGAGAMALSRVNAAPTLGKGEENSELGLTRPDLVSTLKDQFGAPPAAKTDTGREMKRSNVIDKKKNDYEKFMEDMGDILGSGR
ncbi:hypothetical protein AMATHDRAFT_57409 [Amanita thiersii Skay4041]|uniref:Uncharacterized protein n=1 Tax=Amanita thiersii Skay4041 TaxID=703135 RepID=A0A2A9NVN1_9AGAR|nr:hypothetical protein AMATHDRAFT_57409 [Amanita thiersii Skay4041]